MNEQDIIASGMIESYCLGLLGTAEAAELEQYARQYAGVKQSIDAFQASLEQMAFDTAVAPAPGVKQSIIQLLDNLALEEQSDLNQLPLLNRYSDAAQWLKLVEPLLPATIEGMNVQELRNDNGIVQLLICTEIDYPDEVHELEQECFIVLKGKCRCYIEDDIAELGAGDFISIPMYKHHDVRVVEPVIAVVQRINVA